MKTIKYLASAAAVAMALTGCGSDGNDGPKGDDGFVGKQLANSSSMVSTVSSASVADGILTVNFKLTDANGAALVGLTNADIGALSFGREGDEDDVGTTDIEGEPRAIWLSYFNKEKNADKGQYTGSSYFKGSSCEDCLTDNGDGSYTLVLNKPIDTLVYDYGYDASATNGIYLGLKASGKDAQTLVHNSFFYWQPSSDSVVERPQTLVQEETCQSCHRPGHDGALSMHGGKHITVESCTFCHTDYNRYDDDNGAEFDGSIKGMAHSIHNVSHESGSLYPQTASNCQTCHKAEIAEPVVDLWKANSDTATCKSCHSTAPAWHGVEGGDFDEAHSNCTTCHTGGEGNVRGAEEAHYTQNAHGLANNLKVVVDEVSVDKTNLEITAYIQVKDGETLVPLSQIDPRDYKYGGKTSAIIVNGISGDDFAVNYQKVGVGSPDYVGSYPVYSTEEADGRIKVTIPNTYTDGDGNEQGFDVAGIIANDATIAISSQIHVCWAFDYPTKSTKRVNCDAAALDAGDQTAPYVVSDTYFFTQAGEVVAESPRVQHAEMAACTQCHDSGIQHRYSNDIDGCASCHNGTRDKKAAGSSNMAYITHSKHYIGGFFKKTDCQTCHGEDGFSISHIKADAAPVAFGKEVTGTNPDGTSILGEQTFVSPQAAACVSCHQPPYGLDQNAVNHINQNGGAVAFFDVVSKDYSGNLVTATGFGLTKDDYDAANVQESCSVCHNDEQLLKAHSNWSSSH